MKIRKKAKGGANVNTNGKITGGAGGMNDPHGSPNSTGNPPPGGTPGSCKRGRTGNGDCVAKPSGNRKADYSSRESKDPTGTYRRHEQSRKANALAHPSKTLARIKAGTSQLDVVQNAQPHTGLDPRPASAKAVAHLARFTARLEHKVERHDAIHARRASRPRY